VCGNTLASNTSNRNCPTHHIFQFVTIKFINSTSTAYTVPRALLSCFKHLPRALQTFFFPEVLRRLVFYKYFNSQDPEKNRLGKGLLVHILGVKMAENGDNNSEVSSIVPAPNADENKPPPPKKKKEPVNVLKALKKVRTAPSFPFKLTLMMLYLQFLTVSPF